MSEAAIQRFIDSLSRRDVAALQAGYHAQASLSDPLHPDLRGPQVGCLWRWRLHRCEGWDVRALTWAGDERKARLRWQVDWRLRERGGRGRTTIDTTFTFWDDLIVRQVDEYPVWPQLGRCQGLTGWALGWLPAWQGRSRRVLAGRLAEFAERGITA